MLYVGAGGLGTVADALGSTVTAFVAGVTATPVPSPTPAASADAPTIESPSEPYTNQDPVDLVGDRPEHASPATPTTGSGSISRSKDQASAPIDEKPLGPDAADDHPGRR